MRANPLRLAVLFTGSLMLMTSGCNMLPLSSSERVQVDAVHSLMNDLSPSYNRSLGIFIREAANLISYGLPTQYGVNLAPYLAAFPAVIPGPPPVTPQINADPSTRELHSIFSGSQLEIDSMVAPGSAQNSYVYTLNAVRTPTFTTGQLVVTTSGTNWVTPSAPPSSYVLNEGRVPQVPNSVDANLVLNLPESAGQVKMQAILDQFDQSGSSPTPRDCSFSFMSNDINIQLSGAYGSPQAVTLSGTTTFQGSSGNDTYQTHLTASNGTLQILLTNTDHAFTVNLAYNNGLLTGEAQAQDGRQLQLATVTQAAGSMPSISYADGTNESWNFTLPN